MLQGPRLVISQIAAVTERPRTGLYALWIALPTYRQMAAMRRQATYIYRASVALNLLSVLVQVFVLKVVWTAVYTSHSRVGSLSLDALITSLTLANLQLWVMAPIIATFLQQRVRDGRVALDLARPVGFLGQLVAQQLGGTAGVLPFVLVATPLAMLVGGLQPPASITAALFYLLSVALAYLVTILLGLLIGLMAFWTLQLTGILVLYRFASQFFAGALIPLQFFPPALQRVATLLPFQAQASLPLSIYLGQAHGSTLLRVLALQFGWVVVLSVLAQAVWRRAARRVEIQGG